MSGYDKKNYGLKIRNNLVHPWWLTTVSLPGMGQPWKIITLSSNQWVCIEKKHIFGCEKIDPERGGATMQTSPLSVCYNSNPMLSKNSHRPQGSQRVDTWRRWIQQSHTKYNFPVRFLRVNTLLLNTWWVPEIGKGGKSLVVGNGNLKKGHIIESVGTPNLVTGRTSNKEWWWKEHGDCLNNIAGRLILRVVGKVLEPPNHGSIAPWNHNTIRLCCWEPCGSGESNESPKRITKIN